MLNQFVLTCSLLRNSKSFPRLFKIISLECNLYYGRKSLAVILKQHPKSFAVLFTVHACMINRSWLIQNVWLKIHELEAKIILPFEIRSLMMSSDAETDSKPIIITIIWYQVRPTSFTFTKFDIQFSVCNARNKLSANSLLCGHQSWKFSNLTCFLKACHISWRLVLILFH